MSIHNGSLADGAGSNLTLLVHDVIGRRRPRRAVVPGPLPRHGQRDRNDDGTADRFTLTGSDGRDGVGEMLSSAR
jgi:hypothetical protein